MPNDFWQAMFVILPFKASQRIPKLLERPHQPGILPTRFSAQISADGLDSGYQSEVSREALKEDKEALDIIVPTLANTLATLYEVSSNRRVWLFTNSWKCSFVSYDAIVLKSCGMLGTWPCLKSSWSGALCFCFCKCLCRGRGHGCGCGCCCCYCCCFCCCCASSSSPPVSPPSHPFSRSLCLISSQTHTPGGWRLEEEAGDVRQATRGDETGWQAGRSPGEVTWLHRRNQFCRPGQSNGSY